MSELALQTDDCALVYGQEFTQYPDDLFIPPQALRVLLDSFSGPLDLLLYLIRKQNIDILDIPMMTITKQYLHYIQVLFTQNDNQKLELAADYLLMATTLAEIKSKLLLPRRPATDEEPDIDPRMELVKRLQEYEEIKLAAQRMDELPRQDRDTFTVQVDKGSMATTKSHTELTLQELLEAMQALLQNAACFSQHEISRELLTVRDRMNQILEQLRGHTLLEFKALYTLDQGRKGLIVSFLAILELARLALIHITQTHAYSSVYIQAVSHGE